MSGRSCTFSYLLSMFFGTTSEEEEEDGELEEDDDELELELSLITLFVSSSSILMTDSLERPFSEVTSIRAFCSENWFEFFRLSQSATHVITSNLIVNLSDFRRNVLHYLPSSLFSNPAQLHQSYGK